ncbi:dTDP-glucose 4,6-dehydratase [Saccharothrix sp. BKS2]|uniref:dTDP-glucose 4,6-dehydratase n=1 Tax=Saccharothrix sp. BKS2 TaxID=3064400 RepID=UPI0039EC5ABB
MREILVTGGAGFIGSHFVKRLLRGGGPARVTVLDALTYAGNTDNLREVWDRPDFAFVKGDILDEALVSDLVAAHDAVVHFAAESHVDRSFAAAGRFVSTNVQGTQTLLEAAMRLGVRKFVHVSTDEVYGPMPSGTAREGDPLRPTTPYAASKAAGDMVAVSYFHTYGVPVCITRSSNNYGPGQHIEKVIPSFVSTLLGGGRIGLHGNGEHVRNWLHVEDHCRGVELVLRHGVPGEVYNIGGGTDLTNNELTALVLRACGADWDSVDYVADRRSNDIRYSLSWEKIANDLAYLPVTSFADGLVETVDWFRANPDRWAPTRPRANADRLPAMRGPGPDAG